MSDPTPVPPSPPEAWARDALREALLQRPRPGADDRADASVDAFLTAPAGSGLVRRLEALREEAWAALEAWVVSADGPSTPDATLDTPDASEQPADAPDAPGGSTEAGDASGVPDDAPAAPLDSAEAAAEPAPVEPAAETGVSSLETPDAMADATAPSVPPPAGAPEPSPLRLPLHDPQAEPAPSPEPAVSATYTLRSATPRPSRGPVPPPAAQPRWTTTGSPTQAPGSSHIHPNMRPGQMPPPGSRQPPMAVSQLVSFDLPNGKVGTPYDAPLVARAKGGEWLLVEHVDLPSDLGLQFDATSSRLQGVPTRDGEHALVVYCRPAGPAGGTPRHPVSAILVVNPDPRALWKNLPSDRSAPYYKPDEEQAVRDAPDGRRLVAASKRGRSHAHKGDFRDDDFELLVDGSTGWTLLAVADGAGSARVSRRGSQIAVATSVRTALRQLGGAPGHNLLDLVRQLADPDARRRIGSVVYEIMGHAAHDAVRDIEAEAQAYGYAPRDFATTLLLAAWRPLPGVGHVFLSFWCGDGAIGLYQRGEGVHLLGDADSGEFAGQTRFLDRSIVGNPGDLMRRLRVKVVSDFTSLVLMTDGVSDPKFETESNLAQPARWDALWDELRPLLDSPEPDRALLDWLDFWSPGNHDDRTLALLW